jgi:glycosyltransferase involved in cell wall biosynthesis
LVDERSTIVEDTNVSTAPLVSVITPVHNGEPWIGECIESVLGQTYRELSLVVVDNCSTDATPETVERFAKRDSRVRLARYEEFIDAVPNHNRAFRLTDPASDYVKLVQADDLLFPECIEKMVDLAGKDPSVGVVSGYRLCGGRVELVGLPFPQAFAPGRFILRQSLLGGPYVTGSPSSLLLRSDLVRRRDPFYNCDFEHCDTEAAYWAFTQSNFALVHQVTTFSRRQAGSRITRAERLVSFWPANTRMLLRYGPEVLSRYEFRRQLRKELANYVWFHLRQRIKPSRWRDSEFHRFHRRMARVLREESRGDSEVSAAMAVVEALLNPARDGARPIGAEV